MWDFVLVRYQCIWYYFLVSDVGFCIGKAPLHRILLFGCQMWDFVLVLSPNAFDITFWCQMWDFVLVRHQCIWYYFFFGVRCGIDKATMHLKLRFGVRIAILYWKGTNPLDIIFCWCQMWDFVLERHQCIIYYFWASDVRFCIGMITMHLI